MNVQDLIVYLTEKHLDGVFEAARALPADKLDWKPSPESRSALDMLQEIATALGKFRDAFTERKIEFDPQKFQQWQAERSQLTSLDELEKRAKKETQWLVDYVRAMNPADLDLPVAMPFPGEFKLADIVTYHYWNCSYHQGQIYYIGTLLAK
jgi:uncharacterized damage-inducible protein DinB